MCALELKNSIKYCYQNQRSLFSFKVSKQRIFVNVLFFLGSFEKVFDGPTLTISNFFSCLRPSEKNYFLGKQTQLEQFSQLLVNDRSSSGTLSLGPNGECPLCSYHPRAPIASTKANVRQGRSQNADRSKDASTARGKAQ